ncbi:unnamed protein product [marine sediment metagenome]|uniref:Uncharacterized protein n=1 Tax=marine sediment metagenome TaxID=412755 RepID=X0U9S3_9ZZZZ
MPKSRARSFLAILCSRKDETIDPSRAAKITIPKMHIYMITYWITLRLIIGFINPKMRGVIIKKINR